MSQPIRVSISLSVSLSLSLTIRGLFFYKSVHIVGKDVETCSFGGIKASANATHLFFPPFNTRTMNSRKAYLFVYISRWLSTFTKILIFIRTCTLYHYLYFKVPNVNTFATSAYYRMYQQHTSFPSFQMEWHVLSWRCLISLYWLFFGGFFLNLGMQHTHSHEGEGCF